ncbi:MAG: hypothetical protein F6J96_23865 [Symploca sp. SIO1C2]|nr:hypothetical protein [Symploca sp. SIO1C2]
MVVCCLLFCLALTREILDCCNRLNQGATITAGGATLIDICVHQLSPHRVTATATLAESHIVLHTWPEL